MSDKSTDDDDKQQHNSKRVVAPYGVAGSSPETSKASTKTFRTSPIPNLMLGGCRMRGYSSSAVDDALSFSPRRKYTDETVSSSLRHEKESASSEPPLSRSNSLINPVALTLLHQVIDDDEDTTMKTSRSPSPEIMQTTSTATEAPSDDEAMQIVDEAPPGVHADPPPCCRPRAIRPS